MSLINDLREPSVAYSKARRAFHRTYTIRRPIFIGPISATVIAIIIAVIVGFIVFTLLRRRRRARAQKGQAVPQVDAEAAAAYTLPTQPPVMYQSTAYEPYASMNPQQQDSVPVNLATIPPAYDPVPTYTHAQDPANYPTPNYYDPVKH